MFQSFENLRDGVQSEIKLAIDNKSYLEKGSPPLKPVWMLLRKESWMLVPPTQKITELGFRTVGGVLDYNLHALHCSRLRFV